jgi:hypothetical protein
LALNLHNYSELARPDPKGLVWMVFRCVKFEARNSKFETNLQIQMTKIQNKSFYETFDNIRRRKP